MPKRDNRRLISERAAYWTVRIGVTPRMIRIRRMTTKWGSCSAGGVVTLADDLASRGTPFMDFVIVHELLHLRVPNHGRLFKVLMTAHVPGWRDMHATR